MSDQTHNFGYEVHHVYAHPSRACAVREWMAELGIAEATLRLNPECPPDICYLCERPLRSLEDQNAETEDLASEKSHSSPSEGA